MNITLILFTATVASAIAYMWFDYRDSKVTAGVFNGLMWASALTNLMIS